MTIQYINTYSRTEKHKCSCEQLNEHGGKLMVSLSLNHNSESN